jgi:hypothetical protein
VSASTHQSGALQRVARASQAISVRYYYLNDFGNRKIVRIQIYRDGLLELNRPVRPTCRYCTTWALRDGNSFIHIVQLDRSSDPEVVVDLFSGGAHCCSYSLIFGFNANGGYYRSLQHMWRNASLRLVDLNHDRRRELFSADDRFAYRFGSYAESFFPPQIWRYQSGRLFDATRQFPRVVRRDRRQMLGTYRRHKGRINIEPSLAVYVADMALLGRAHAGFRLARVAQRKGYTNARYSTYKGRRFLPNLRRLLRRWGYL